jgi:hypothetical protein
MSYMGRRQKQEFKHLSRWQISSWGDFAHFAQFVQAGSADFGHDFGHVLAEASIDLLQLSPS